MMCLQALPSSALRLCPTQDCAGLGRMTHLRHKMSALQAGEIDVVVQCIIQLDAVGTVFHDLCDSKHSHAEIGV